jgi:conjugative relaxase-like TrwC/TraI family protein
MTVSYAKLETGPSRTASSITEYMVDVGGRADTYYSQGQELKIALIGTERVRRELGFENHWFEDSKALGSLLEGKHPVSGERIRKPGQAEVRKWDEELGRMVSLGRQEVMVNHDLTLSHVPKSVSVLWAMATPKLRREIELAVLYSADMAMRELTREPLIRERYGPGKSDIRNVATPDVVGGLVLHTTARPTAATPHPDPQLHVHSLLIGALDKRGRLVSIDSPVLLQNKRQVDANAGADLAERMRRLGFAIERSIDARGRVSWELAGVPREVCQEMSSRRAEIEQLKADHQKLVDEIGTRAGTLDEYLANHRQRKVKIDPDGLAADWATRGRERGFGIDEAHVLAEQAASRASETGSSELARQQLRQEILTTLCMEHALVPEREVWTVALDHAKGLTGVEEAYEVVEQMLNDGDLLLTSDRRHITTRAVAGNETRCSAMASHLLSLDPLMPMSEQTIQGILAEAEAQGRPYDLEQVEAVRLAISGRHLVSICGPAGAGKGFASAGMVNAWHSQGRRTIAVAVAGRTAEQAQADSGAMEGDTVDGLLTWDVKGIGLASTDVVICDEAGQLDHVRYTALLDAVGRAGATLIQVGDEKQLSPVGPGGLWTVIHGMAEEEAASGQLRKVRRARDEREAQAWTDLREGRITPALSWWQEQGRLNLYDGRQALREAMVAAWQADGQRGCMVIDSSNRERGEINRQAQALRVAAGELGEESVELAEGRTVRVGDQVIFSEIYRTGGVKVKNGTLGLVEGVNRESGTARLRLSEPRRKEQREVVVNAGAPVELAYCRHIAKAQGMTADGIAQVAISAQSNANTIYTAVSRGRAGAQIHMERSELPALALAERDALQAQHQAELSKRGLDTADADMLAQLRARDLEIAHVATGMQELERLASRDGQKHTAGLVERLADDEETGARKAARIIDHERRMAERVPYAEPEPVKEATNPAVERRRAEELSRSLQQERALKQESKQESELARRRD